MMRMDLAGAAVIVTGATGFLGSHLVAALHAAGARVHALRTTADRPSRLLPPAGVQWQECDVLDSAGLRALAHAVQPEVVFHLAAYGTTTSHQAVDRMFDVNVRGTWNLWRALEGGSCRFIMLGSCGEYGRLDHPARESDPCQPLSPYTVTKHAAVTLVSSLARLSQRPAVILRPYGPYGPGDDHSRVLMHTITGLLRGEAVPLTGGEQRRDFLFVEDHGAAMLAAATTPGLAPGAVYNIGSGHSNTLRELLEEVARVVQGPGRLEFGARPYRSDEVWDMTADITAARRDLGFVPRVTFEDGIRRTAAWMRADLPVPGTVTP